MSLSKYVKPQDLHRIETMAGTLFFVLSDGEAVAWWEREGVRVWATDGEVRRLLS